MIKAAICYFSGTGNTEYVAKQIQEKLAGQAPGNTVDIYRIEDIFNNKISVDLASYDMLGIGTPCYGFNPARLVCEFAKSLAPASGLPVFLFLTCAGPCYMNDAALFGLKNILRRRGCHIINEKAFSMPANIMIQYPDHVVRLLIEAAEKIAGQMAREIASGEACVRRDRFLPYLTHGILRLLVHPLMRTSLPLDFHISRDCNNCQLCIRVCPRHNISLKKRIRHGFNCEACYRCVYACPKRAIRGRLFNWAILKDGYAPMTPLAGDENCTAQPLTGIYKSLEKYLAAAERQK
jgi:flavodoxin/ferredoxin